MSRLTHEQVDLLHHVELAEAGWQDRLWEQLVVAAVVKLGGASENDVMRAVLASVNASAEGDQILRAVQRLLGRKALVSSGGRLIASQVTLAAAEQGSQRSARIENEARAAYVQILTEEVPEGLESYGWEWFVHVCLEPLVLGLGAKTYELLTSVDGTDEGAEKFTQYLDSVPEKDKKGVRRAVERFFSTASLSVRAHVLRLVHAYLLSSAARLPKASLQDLQSRMRSSITLKVLLDTNFVFSILGLHENPSNDAAADLMQLIAQVQPHVKVMLYVTPLTLDEARRTLKSYERTLREVPVSPQVSAAALQLDGELSGIALKYFDAVKRAGHRISVDQYLGPYLEDLTTVVRSRGVELYNENIEALSSSQPVVDDILEQQAFEKSRYGSRAKSYEKLRHDVTVWHLAHRKRPSTIDSPLDAVYWIATLDYRFLGFDGYKRRQASDSVPLCVHPTVLIQLLQFWVPRNAELDGALFDSLGALLPHSFDSDAEAMCLRIVGSLSRFENVDDLPAETVTSILVNRALRARLKGTPSIEAQLALVRDAIVEEVALAKDALEGEKTRAAALRQELDRLNAERTAADDRMRATAEQHAVATQNLNAEIEREREKQSALASKVEELQRWVDDEKRTRGEERLQGERASRERRQRIAVVAALAVPAAVLFVAAWLGASVFESWGFAKFRARLAATTVAVGLWTAVLWCCGTLESVASWSVYGHLKTALGWVSGVMTSTLVGNTLWDWWSN